MSFGSEDNWAELPQYLRARPVWQTAVGKPSAIVFQARCQGNEWLIRMNDFPDEPAYTLIVSGREIIHFNDWPDEWRARPPFPR